MGREKGEVCRRWDLTLSEKRRPGFRGLRQQTASFGPSIYDSVLDNYLVLFSTVRPQDI
jgi:hypothetical protein